mmetsp:Transcript_18924/g.30168  ORF Transcript_18924/g.30168 Transcript_18924/m.30168 type:complete len:481 (-) Transcript_18924:328-1770(-)
MGQAGSKNLAKTSSSLHLRDKKELAGVGVIFRKNPDGMLIVKDVVGGSAADESGLIEPGDCLTQVDDVKVAKASIADISGMVLGTPGESVKLKFTRAVGKSKKKYKVVLKRTVRASLEPTYHVQRDGINTKVTHIHLDCLQNQESNEAPAAAVNQARDVLDADGNVVGPGLLQRARTAGPGVAVPGVERIDASHPAWPGAKKKQTTKQGAHTGATPVSMPKKQRAPEPVDEPAEIPATAAGDTNSLMDAFMSDGAAGGVGGGNDAASFMDSFAAPAPTVPTPEPRSPPPEAQPVVEQDFGISLADPPSPAPVQVAAAPHQEEEEEQDDEDEETATDSNVPDWEGLAQSRLAVFEAKAREGQPATTKKVDLEKEWARSAAKAAGPATPTALQSVNVPETAAPAPPAATLQDPDPVPVTIAFKSPEPEKAKSSPFGNKVVKSSTPAASTPKPEKMGAKGDLAAMMAARRKAQEENEDDGYYF